MAGRRPPTLHDVARHAGVSVSTASRALNGGPHVSGTMLHKVRTAAEALGYYPNVHARGLRLQKTMTLGIVVSDLATAAQLELLNGLTRAAAAHDYTVLLANAAGEPSRVPMLIRRLLENRVDGVVVHNARGIGAEAKQFADLGIPLLATLTRDADSEAVPLVLASAGEAAEAMAARLCGLGHRQAGILGGNALLRSGFFHDIQAALTARGLEVRYEATGAVFDRAHVAAALHRQLEASPPATVIITMNQAMHVVVKELEDSGLQAPRDVSLCSIADAPEDLLARPQTATLSVDARELGAATARLLIEWINGRPPRSVTALDLTTWSDNDSVGAAPAGAADPPSE